MPKLRIEDLKVTYGPIVGTDGVALSLEPGETMTLIGANGAGKSSTLKAVLGMTRYEGRITLDGADLAGLKASDVVRRGVGYAPEGRRVFPQLSVIDNLKAGALSRPASEVPERLARIYQYFPRLKERASQRAGSLSGGEQQMLAIGRALMSKPSVLLLDEPSLGLRAGDRRAHRRDPAGDQCRRGDRGAAGRAECRLGAIACHPRRDPRCRPRAHDRRRRTAAQ
jgi:branched-chain amino acid transport system ATP-binding protein